MTTDRELLELAAKAAGLRVKYEIENMDDECIGLCVKVDGRPKFDWNPLDDDGDALRLAVKLELDIVFLNGDTIVLTASQGGGDPNERTRRAIVCAAAEIGRRMP